MSERLSVQARENQASTRWKWRAEYLVQTALEHAVGRLSGPAAFRLGELLGGLAWHLMKSRRRTVLRNLRIALHGKYDLPELETQVRESFRRTGANLVSAAHTSRLARAELDRILHVENLEILSDALTAGRGMVIMPPHMGNWEILSRMNGRFPGDPPQGAFYRPLNNPFLDARIHAQRSADGTRLFSKRDGFHQVTGFIRSGGIVGILADQRVGRQGEVVRFFGRLTRASPLPALMARRSKCPAFSLSLATVAPGKWSVRFHPMEGPATTPACMMALETAMATRVLDVFWLQDRWKVYVDADFTIRDWLGPESDDPSETSTPHRALLWMAGDPWQLPDSWRHREVRYEVVLTHDQALPPGLDPAWKIHRLPAQFDSDTPSAALHAIDRTDPLPVDFLLARSAAKGLKKAVRQLPATFVDLSAAS